MSAIVGRAVEIDHIRRLVDDQGTPVVTLVGEPGIGKSTLLDLACARAAQQGITVRRTDADEIGVSQPFGFIGRLLGDAWHPAQADLQPLALVDLVLDALETASPDGRLLLALDNLQWADTGSLRVLASVVRRFVPHGGKAVLAMRPAPVSDALERLLDAAVEVGGLDLPLAPLTGREVIALARDRLGGTPSTGLVRAVEQAGGNPFYVTTLLRDLDFHQRLRRTEGGVSLDDGVVAPTLNRLLVRRAKDLGADVFELLQSAAVLGRTMTLSDLAALRDTTAEATAVAVHVASDAQLLTIATDGDRDEVTFRHDLVMAALRDHTPPATRRTLHRRALSLLQASGARADRLAPHLLALEPDVVPTHELVRVARSCAPDLGLRLVEHALGRVADDDLALAVSRPELLLWCGQPQLAAEAAALLVEQHGGHPGVEPARAVYSHAMFLMGKARAFAADAADDLDAHVTQMTPARYKAEMGMAVLFAADATRARRMADDALRLNATAPAADSEVTEAIGRAVRGFIDGAQGRMDDGLADLRAASALVTNGGPEVGFAGPELFHASLLLVHGDARGAAAAVERDDRGSADFAALLRLPVRHAIRSAVLFELGDWDSAMAEVDAAAALAAELGVSVVSSYATAVGALIHTYRGNLEPAAAALKVGLGGAGSEWVGLAHAALADARGDTATALPIAQFTFDALMGTGMTALTTQIAPRLARWTLAGGGDADPLRQQLAGIRFVGAAPAAEARLQWATAMLDGDVASIGQAAVALFELGYVFDAAMAWRDAEAIGRGPLDPRAVTILQQLDIGSPAPAGGTTDGSRRRTGGATFGWEAITDSEQRVLDLLAEGLDNATIAERLFLSRRTVESHLSHVYTKLAVSGRSRLLAMVLQRQG